MTDDVITEREGHVGRIRLNRPKALNALTTAMCAKITEALLAWRADPGVVLILIDHIGDRGFCAGGDIRAMAEAGRDDPAAGAAFFLTEYRMNELLQRYPKPVCAIMDGIVMGGGVGLSVYAQYRVGTEYTVFAMPETGIGLFPDIGAGWFLSRLPGEFGTWMALTGARLRPANLMYLNLLTHHVRQERLSSLKEKLVAMPHEAKRILMRFHDDPGQPGLSGKQSALDSVFEHDAVEEIVAALKAGSTWAQEQAEILSAKSPTSMKVALRELREAREKPTFADQIATEYRLAVRMIQTNDFQEGVRAIVVDKTVPARWSPARLEDVTDATLDALFAPFDDQPEFTPLDR
jgi:enoyl-CoA hydratase